MRTWATAKLWNYEQGTYCYPAFFHCPPLEVHAPLVDRLQPQNACFGCSLWRHTLKGKLPLRESAKSNKFSTFAREVQQPMVRQILSYCILAKICGHRISFQPRSRLNQCTSSITQHVTPTCDSNMSLLYHWSFMLFAATLFFILRGKSTMVLFNPLEETVCVKIVKHTMVTRRRASVLLHAWCCKNGDGCPTNLRFRNPFQIWSFLLLQPRHMIYLNVHALRIQNVHHFGNMICGFRIHI